MTSSTPTGTTVIGRDTIGLALHIHDFSTDNEAVDIHDLTDGAGHGILIATDNIFLVVQGLLTSYGAATTGAIQAFAQADLIYRFKEVALAEYIGIVQSQQN